MTKPSTLLASAAFLLGGLTLGMLLAPPQLASASAQDEQLHGPGEGLLAWMGQLQYLSHKTHLAVSAEDGPQAQFYLHELEETVEHLAASIPDYDGHPVGQLTPAMLNPAITALDQAVDAGDWPLARQRSGELFQACNACHAATEHAMIRVAPPQSNPYAQQFGGADALKD